MKYMRFTSFIILLLFFITACSSETSNNNQQSDKIEKEETVSLSIGLMPAVDAAPILLAEKEGYFDDLNLDLDAKIYTNANNRQSAIQANELDGTMTDLIAYINNKHNGFDTKIVTSTDGSFAFLVGDNFEQKGRKKLGIMEVSVSNYLADHYVAKDYNIEKVYIPEIPTRLEMVQTEQLDIGFFPEPIASNGEVAGLTKLISITDDDGYMPEAMVFTTKALNEKREAIQRFIKGYNQAVNAINSDDTLAREVLIEAIDLKPEIQDLITLPTYHQARIPSEEYMNKIITWVEEAQKIQTNLKYDEMIAKEYTES
ncbi:hypothetical protein Pryu01_02363 [Paraliobacillus ryukyuensis]|uniref:NitT/TauT family transport system substrate-binding protein n=1 Tax=Paraliobacillus ryukyuensis TaxID=200904 RepID=A0A366DYH6_9BACI|nr:ABC transporter substrate-binding protein [Paraliobacillus ryukyuensis]RBO94579.1 NitT/TauT family transport system substrate-binding protein [Paraliobacillus ryukyuensis]